MTEENAHKIRYILKEWLVKSIDDAVIGEIKNGAIQHHNVGSLMDKVENEMYDKEEDLLKKLNEAM